MRAQIEMLTTYIIKYLRKVIVVSCQIYTVCAARARMNFKFNRYPDYEYFVLANTDN